MKMRWDMMAGMAEWEFSFGIVLCFDFFEARMYLYALLWKHFIFYTVKSENS